MNKMPRLILEASKQFEITVFGQAGMETAEPIDIKTTVAPALGLVTDASSKDGFKFDTNSKVADVIFNAMDAKEYKGTVKIDLTVDQKKTGALIVTCDPAKPDLSTLISSKLTSNVNAALKKLSKNLAGTITIKEIVSAWNQ